MRSIEHIINRQIELWNTEKDIADRIDENKLKPTPDFNDENNRPHIAAKPIIAIAPQLGCGSRAVCEILSRRIGYELFGFKIIDKVAENMQVRRQLIDRMDQRKRSYIHTMVEGLLTGNYIEQEDYFRHLIEVLEAFVVEGGCTLLGRGAPYVVPEGAGIRVRLTASREKRIVNLTRYYPIDSAEAERRMTESDNERAAFSQKYFGKDIDNPEEYDLVINLDRITPATAVSSIVQCMYSMRTKRHDALRRILREQDARDLVERQIERWENYTRQEIAAMHDDLPGDDALEVEEKTLPVVALSTKFCAGSRLVAQALDDRLGYELFGFRIIDQVAEDMNLNPRIVDRLDQRKKSSLQAFVDKFTQKATVNRQEYFESLVKTVRALIMQGGLTLLGRGAPFMVEKGEGVRVRLVASFEKRMKNMKDFYNIEGKEAEERLKKVDKERQDFNRQYFNIDGDSPSNYDLTLNLDRLVPDAVADVIIQALEPLQE